MKATLLFRAARSHSVPKCTRNQTSSAPPCAHRHTRPAQRAQHQDRGEHASVAAIKASSACACRHGGSFCPLLTALVRALDAPPASFPRSTQCPRPPPRRSSHPHNPPLERAVQAANRIPPSQAPEGVCECPCRTLNRRPTSKYYQCCPLRESGSRTDRLLRQSTRYLAEDAHQRTR